MVETSPTPLAEVAGSRAVATAAGMPPSRDALTTSGDESQESENKSLLVWALAVIAFGAMLTGVYVYTHPELQARLVRWKPPNL
jgi:hypothetical protein